MKKILLLISFISLFLGEIATAQGQERKVQAIPLKHSIAIDGRLDEPEWQQAEPASGFYQLEPIEGDPATFSTEVRILYGPAALYVGARMFDNKPEAIVRTLSRRDELNQADRFWFYVDSYLSRKTAYVFAVSAGGVLADGLINDQRRGFRGNGVDLSWDAVWEADVSITEDGWVAELRIPYSMLRFNEAEEQVWGVNFRRQIARLSEDDYWVLVPRTESGFVSHFGLLTGIYGIRPRRNVQVSPYSVSRLKTFPEGEPERRVVSREFDMGLDLKYGLTSSLTLDATINPDFGQVESDPAVLNLTTFETFYPEKRPFFLEGREIFNYSLGREGALLYTRRIGTERSPIITATKLTGRTDRGTSVGVLGAVTGADFIAERFYGVARVRQDLDAYSQIGGMTTFYRTLSRGEGTDKQTWAGGIDWDLRFKENTYRANGSVNFTAIQYPGSSLPAKKGYAIAAGFDKIRGDLTLYSGFRIYSDTFDPNDVGRLRQNDFIRISGGIGYIPNHGRPFGPFLRVSSRMFGWNQWTYAKRTPMGAGFFVFTNAFLRSYQQVNLILNGEQLGGYDVRETRGLGPYRNAGRIRAELSVQSDSRKKFRYRPGVNVLFTGTGGRGYALNWNADWDVATWLTLSPQVSYQINENIEAWAANVAFVKTDEGWAIGPPNMAPGYLEAEDLTPLQNSSVITSILQQATPYQPDVYYLPVFADRDTRQFEFSFRGNVLFSPNLSLQLYSQIFVARGHYDSFRLLVTPDELEELPEYPHRHDFALNSFILNAVLRWEYRPGSILYLVWSQNRRGYEAQLGNRSPYDNPTWQQLQDTFSLFPSNVFLIKLNYLFLR